MSEPADFVPVAVVERSGRVESVHSGAVVVIDPDGDVVYRLGNPDSAIYGRSCNKPVQADAMLWTGVELKLEQLALAAASHAGLPRHIDVIRSILADAGLDDLALGNVAGLPMDDDAATKILAAGETKHPILHGCSGKHAAMLATCVANGWPTNTYLELDHPLQQAIIERFADLAGGVIHIGIDGCGAPTHMTTLIGLARAYGSIGASRSRVWEAMTSHPDLVSGPGREPTTIMEAESGLMAKDGADGVFAGATADGWAIAIKIGDGAERAAPVVFVRAAQHAGLLTDADPSSFGGKILGLGRPVGAINPLF